MFETKLETKNQKPAETLSAEAEALLKQAQTGDAAAQFTLGWRYTNGQGVGKDDQQATAWFQKAALQGDADAQFNLGICYAKGRGVEKDAKQAVAWYQKAALQGHADAQFSLGIRYINGQGVEKDEKQAAAWYQKAALQGYAPSQYALGICYANGQGVKQDFGQAMAWYQKAADQGIVDARTQLESLKKQGYIASSPIATLIADSKDSKETKADSKPDTVTEFQTYLEQAQQGNAGAQNYVGICYESGHGVAKDVSQAAGWYQKAAAQGDASARIHLETLKKQAQNIPPLAASASAETKEAKNTTVEVSQTTAFSKPALVGGPGAAASLPSPLPAARVFSPDTSSGPTTGASEPVRVAQPASSLSMLETKLETKHQKPAETLSADVEALLKQAQASDAAAQYQLGECYFVGGKGLIINEAEAVIWFKKAALQGYALAEYRLGFCLYYGYGIEQDKAKAEALFLQALPAIQKAAAEGDADAQVSLGRSYLEGWGGVKKDEKHRFVWTQKAALQGLALAQCNLGICYENGQGVEKDDKQAVAWYQKAVLQGFGQAQYELGFNYANGQGVEKDEKQAAAWYQKAALQGFAQAQYELGGHYARGRGVEKDEKQAVAWYQKAALQGLAAAQFNLGLYYAEGEGVEKDEKQAAAWYQKAALQGLAQAQHNLGRCYANGQGVEKDEKQAAAWCQKAAMQGDVLAQYHLGLCYANGLGVKQDFGQAMAWYQKAADQGNVDARTQVEALKKQGYIASSPLATLIADSKDSKETKADSKPDTVTEFQTYLKQAQQGDAGAQNYLGFCYESGQGVAKDLSQAAAWYQKAADQGDASARTNLEKLKKQAQNASVPTPGASEPAPIAQPASSLSMLETKLETKHQKPAETLSAEAEALLKQAQAGDAAAQFNLGWRYANGQGVEKDDKQAAAWYQKAALQGYAVAQFNLGFFYENGQGVEKDGEAPRAYARGIFTFRASLVQQLKKAVGYTSALTLRSGF